MMYPTAMWRAVAVLMSTATGCGNDPGATGDASVDPDAAMIDAPRGPCWPADGRTPRGTIELGIGETAFIPMPDEVYVEYGPQGGFHVPVHARVTSMMPGNPMDVLDPGNPRTRFGVTFLDTGVPITPSPCPLRLAY